MNSVIDVPRNDIPIVSDTTLLSVPQSNDDAGRAEYLKKLRALRAKPSAEVEPKPVPVAMDSASADISDTEQQPSETLEQQANSPSSDANTTDSNKIRLSRDDLKGYELPVWDDDGSVHYLSLEEFEKTVGLYSKQNKKARELAEREREVETLKTQLVEEHGRIVDRASTRETEITGRYEWVQTTLAFAHQHNLDTVKFEDGSKRTVTQLITEKTSLENEFAKLQRTRAESLKKLEQAQQEFIQAQDKILEQRAPELKAKRGELAKFLESQGFTPQESQALSSAKAELLLLFEKARRWDSAQKSENRERKVNTNTKVINQPSRLSGRGAPVNSGNTSRIEELTRKGTKANADELRELRRLQLQRK